ncbi:MAG TPA: Maf family nucleotide pyrophosphatase [Acetobacteraceae bacterium]
MLTCEPALILASASSRRLQLLAQIGVAPDRILAPDINEAPLSGELPRDCARRLARAKAATVPDPGCLVLAADTIVAVGRRILPKAETPEQARTCLNLLSGRRHRVITAVTLRHPRKPRAERLVSSVVSFVSLSETQIRAYVETGEWRGKAGGYAIQGRAAGFIKFLSGSYSNVVGLPLFETAQLLRGAGWPLP